MTLEIVRSMFAWSTVINWAWLLFWWFFISVAHHWTYRYHSKWFKITPEEFDVIHYKGMAFFKIGILLFNLAPYSALRIVG